MQEQALISIFQNYIEKLIALGAVSSPFLPKSLEKGERKIDKALFICYNSIELLKKGEVEKSIRWLGFVQGILWSENISYN